MIISARRRSRNCVIIVLILLSLLQWQWLIHAYRHSLNYFFLFVGVLWTFRYTPRLVGVLVSGRTACEASRCSQSDEQILTDFLTTARKLHYVCLYRKTVLWTTWVGDGGSSFIRNNTTSPPIKPQCLQRRENQRYDQRTFSKSRPWKVIFSWEGKSDAKE
jgi:hypothetical protein